MNRTSLIYLTGMMGSWKTTVGKKLAKALSLSFVDIDDEVEKITGKTISDVFRRDGITHFRNLETYALKKTSQAKNTVIATGGGIVLKPTNREIMMENGFIVLLKASPNVLARRIQNIQTRPVLKSNLPIIYQLETLWEERRPYYEDIADYTLNTDSLSPKNITDTIKEYLTSQNAND
ncbi:MAG: shikimate kinase [Candidatus Marinimicrobia bacterium]|nr:shikimate kinase [Candidatus Neomarinimicrobiota bacterium]MBL7060070.1 shikimate kinase [Candidatus Neomarinimicrobiota bacterium]